MANLSFFRTTSHAKSMRSWSVGNWSFYRDRAAGEGVGREAVAEVVERIMVCEEAAEMRSRARYYKVVDDLTMD